MAGKIVPGQRTWLMTRDRDGQREYKIKFLVECLTGDGPAIALSTPGLPIPGDFWIVDNDSDLWATCKLDAQIKPVAKENHPNKFFEIEFTFSTKGDEKRCKDQQIDNPLLQPQQVSGGFKNYQEEATHDRFGDPITNSAFEIIRGQQVEFDKNRGTVKIQQNVPDLQLPLIESMVDTVNDSILWGMAPRTIKLSPPQWEKKYYGLCLVYYSRTFEFEIRRDGFDKFPLDEGTKVLSGHWDSTGPNWILDPIKDYGIDHPDDPNPNPEDPQHFIRFVDRAGNPTKVILNGGGLPVGVNIGSGADAIPILSPGPFSFIEEIVVGSGGAGYDAAPRVIISGGGGSGATAIAIVEDGVITEIVVINGGTNYTSAPSVTFGTLTQPSPIRVEKYPESNFLLLGIPTVL